MITLKKSIALVMTLGLFLAAQAQDGVKIISKTKSLDNGSVVATELYLTATKMRLNNSGSDKSSIMFDSKTELFTFIDNNKKEYYELDKATMIQLKQQISAMATMMKQFAQQMPAAQKKKFDAIMNPDGQPVISYNPISGSTVGKWKTKGFEGISADEKVMETQIASYSTLGIASADFEVMKKMMSYMKKYLSGIMSMLPNGSSYSSMSFDENSPILKDGIPVKTIAYKGGKAVNENVIESVTKTSIPSDMFAIPKGYKRQEINMQSMTK